MNEVVEFPTPPPKASRWTPVKAAWEMLLLGLWALVTLVLRSTGKVPLATWLGIALLALLVLN